LEKLPFYAGLTTESAGCRKIFPADRVPLVRFEIFFLPKIFGLKIDPPGFFGRESFSGRFFSARKLKILKNFRLKVENFKKCWRESWKKDC
jgi:hypothetical protein